MFSYRVMLMCCKFAVACSRPISVFDQWDALFYYQHTPRSLCEAMHAHLSVCPFVRLNQFSVMSSKRKNYLSASSPRYSDFFQIKRRYELASLVSASLRRNKILISNVVTCYRQNVARIVPSTISIDLSFSRSCCMRPVLGQASLTLLIGRSYKHFSTGANDLVFATVKLMILPLCSTADKQLYNRILNQPEHVLHPLLPPPSASQYKLRHRPHNRLLCQRASRLTDCNFIIRMLYCDMY